MAEPTNDFSALLQLLAGGGSIAPEQYGQDSMNLTPEELLMRSLTANTASPAPITDPLIPQDNGISFNGVNAADRAFINASYESSNNAIAAMLASNPELLQIPGTKLDPDNQYRDIPRTGVADTRGGVARVNQYTGEHGVTASKDPKTGQVTLTNIGSDGKPTPQSQVQRYGFNPLSGTGSTAVTTLLTQLREAKDPDTARGIASTLRTSLATESANLEAAADKFAENKLGIPQMRRQLQQAEALDSQRPGYMPGIGDSANTAAVRKQLYTAEAQARAVSTDYLKSNLSAAQLRSAAENASAELNRIEKLSAKADTRQLRREDRQYEREEKAAEAYDSLAPSQKLIAARLNPELAQKPDNHGEMVAYVQRQAKMDPNFIPVMNAEPADLPALAVQGNPLARKLVVQDESAATGKPADEVDRNIQAIGKLADKPTAINDYVAIRANQVPAADRVAFRKNEIARITALKMGTTKADKAQWAEEKTQMSMEIYKAQRTQQFIMDVNSWGMADPELEAAVKISSANTGTSSIDNVLAAYVGTKTGPEALTAYASFKQKLKVASDKQALSKFGGINSLAALSMVDEQAIRNNGSSLASWWKERWSDPAFHQTVDMISNVIPFQR